MESLSLSNREMLMSKNRYYTVVFDSNIANLWKSICESGISVTIHVI